VDPGPGALSNMNRIHMDPECTDSLIISHCHPDHYSDAEVVIEGICKGGFEKRGHVYGSLTVVHGKNGLGPCLSEYHRDLPESVQSFVPGDVLDIDGMTTEITEARHSDDTNVGFRFHTEDGIVSYVSDTGYSDEIADQYIGSRVIILPVTTPDDQSIPYHLCTHDTVRFIDRVKPELAIFTHMGLVMLHRGPALQAAYSQSKTGVRTIAAEDLMTVDIGDTLDIGRSQTFEGQWIPDHRIFRM
jgi:phosphoribosyl 1,2-cyclic phosphodiesterase